MHRRFVPLEAGAWAPPLRWHGVVVQAIDADEAAWLPTYANFLSGDTAHGVLGAGGRGAAAAGEGSNPPSSTSVLKQKPTFPVKDVGPCTRTFVSVKRTSV